ncbi:MAG: ABC transporter, partial [Pusillimonas sp.]
VKKLETEMDKVRTRLVALNALMANPEFYSDGRREERLKALAEHGDLSKRTDLLEEQWLELQEQLEELVSSDQ